MFVFYAIQNGIGLGNVHRMFSIKRKRKIGMGVMKRREILKREFLLGKFVK